MREHQLARRHRGSDHPVSDGTARMPAVKLPRVAPNKAEVAEIVAMLEDDSYDNGEKMARAIVAKTYELLLKRDWYTIVHQPDLDSLVYTLFGFFSTENAAVKALGTPEKYGLSGGRAGTFKVTSLARMEDRMEAADEMAVNNTTCATCGHQQAGHEFSRTRGGCIGKDCSCRAFVKV